MGHPYCSRCLRVLEDEAPTVCPRIGCEARCPEGGWPTYESLDSIIAGRYRVIELLGSGGAGLTYRCLDLSRHEQVAVKVLHADRRNGMLGQRLALEGEILERLDHPNIVPFRSVNVVVDGPAYLATLYMPGGTLSELVRREGALPLGSVAELGRQIAVALSYVHDRGIVHRDIKPSNLLLESVDLERLSVRLVDFGIARIVGKSLPTPDLTQTGVFVGTPEYAAPEQVRGEKGVGPGADCFALGAVLHFAATGESLLRCSSVQEWVARRECDWDPSQRPRIASEVASEARPLARLLDEVIDGLMHADPARRARLDEVAERLGAAQLDHASSVGGYFVPSVLCDVPEPVELQQLAKVWADPEVGSSQDELPELLSDSWVSSFTAAEEVVAQEAVTPTLEMEWQPSFSGSDPVQLSPLRTLLRSPSPRSDLRRDLAEEDRVVWPTPGMRRRRLGLLVLAALCLLGVSLAWSPGEHLIDLKAAVSSSDLLPAEDLRVEASAPVEQVAATEQQAESGAPAPAAAPSRPARRAARPAAASRPRPSKPTRVASRRKAPEPKAKAKVESEEPGGLRPWKGRPGSTPAREPERESEPAVASAEEEGGTESTESPVVVATSGDVWGGQPEEDAPAAPEETFDLSRLKEILEKAGQRAESHLDEAFSQELESKQLESQWKDVLSDARRELDRPLVAVDETEADWTPQPGLDSLFGGSGSEED